jgi:hypothetical protein
MQAGGLNMTKFIVLFAISQTHIKTGVQVILNISLKNTTLLMTCTSVKTGSGNCGM